LYKTTYFLNIKKMVIDTSGRDSKGRLWSTKG